MMAILRSYRCPECEGVFEFLHHPSDEPPPSHCPLCGKDVSKKKKTRLASQINKPPSIKTVVSKSADSVYRSLETSAETRRQEAAALLGVDPSKLNGMKTTNMKDNMRIGDMSHVPASPVQGSAVDMVRPDGKPLGSHFGMADVQMPGKPTPQMNNIMSSTFASHQNRVQATVASGKKN